ncbi:phage tail protein [Streptomyces wuyuanensis]|uniref:phage tail protein n=1 Tax=Streptomyces wuyuanensis TaxID=1196353 RepID=UPI00344169D1
MTEPSNRPLALPAALARDPGMREFAERVALMLQPFPRALDDFPRLLDAWRTDSAWLDWLTQITGAPGTAQWDEAARRAAIESAASLTARQGTHEALVREAALLGWELSVSDPGQVSMPNQPLGPRRPLVVALAWSPADAIRLVTARPQLDAMVRRHCPAHVPHTVVVSEGFAPSAALSLPPGLVGDTQPHQTVFFYGPHLESDQTVGYDLSVPAPVPGSRRLDERWSGLNQLGENGRDFTKGYIDGTAYYPEFGFYLISGERVARWDKSALAFTKIATLSEVFPGLPRPADDPEQPRITQPIVDDVLSVPSGINKGLYVFSGEDSYYYTSPGAKNPNKKKIKELYTSDLPPEFHRDLDAVAEDPLREGVHFLINGPQCAEIDGFAYKATHLIRDIWPGLPVRTASGQIGGGALTIGAELVPLHVGFRISYFARTLSEGAWVYLYEGTKKPSGELTGLDPVSQKKAPGSAGTLMFEDDVLTSPGSYTFYYIDPAFNKLLSDPAEFTAILKKEDYGTFALKGGNIANRKSPAFTCQTPYPRGAALSLYSAGDRTSDLDEAQKDVPTPLLSKPIRQTTGAQEVATSQTFPPGPYKAYLLARDGHAFLAEPLKDITLALDAGDVGTLKLEGTADNGKGTIPLGDKTVVSYTSISTEKWTTGTLHVFPQTSQDAPANTLPSVAAVTSFAVKLDTPYTLPSPLPVGGYTSYFCAGKAWLAEPKRFTVTAPLSSGKLTIKTSSSGGSPNVLTYATQYADPHNQIVVVPEFNAQDPTINTDASQWTGCVYRTAASEQSGTITITAADLLPPNSPLEAMPGIYCVHFLTATGGPLAEPELIKVTLNPSQYESLRIASPANPDKDITTKGPVKLEFTNKYFSPQHPHHIYIVGPKGSIHNGITEENRTTLEISKNLYPGKHTVNYWAYPVPLAEPISFLVHAAPSEGKLAPPATAPYMGDKITIGYETKFSEIAGYAEDNRVEIYRTSDQPGKDKPVQSLKVAGKKGTVEAAGLTSDDYRVHFLGKDDSVLAPAQALTVKARTVILHIADSTQDSWTATPTELTGCTTSGQSSIPPTPDNANTTYVNVTFTQNALVDQLSATLTCEHPEHDQKVNIKWTMKTADESTLYTVDGPEGLTAQFSLDQNTWSSTATCLKGDSGGGPTAEIWVKLQNIKHRSLSITLDNTLTFPMNLEGTPTAINAVAKDSAKPESVGTGETKKFTYTAVASPDDSSGTVTYKFKRPDRDQEEVLVLAWTSHPGKTPPEYTIKLPDEASIEAGSSWIIDGTDREPTLRPRGQTTT